MPQMERLWINLDEVLLDNKNPNEGDVGSIITSIKQFGYRNPIHQWRGQIIKLGNHRIKALRFLRQSGWQPTGTALWVKEDGSWWIAYEDISDMEEREAIAYAIADNRTNRLGRDDETVLGELLQDIYEYNPVMGAATGYSADDLDEILALNEAEVDPEDDPELDLNPDERLDVYINNAIRQIVLYFSAEQYEDVLGRLGKLMAHFGVDNNTEVFLKILEAYEHAQVTG